MDLKVPMIHLARLVTLFRGADLLDILLAFMLLGVLGAI